MDKIKVELDMLETGVSYFAFASKEAGDMHYRLKLLGTELTEDVELMQSPEYTAVMLAYEEAMKAVEHIYRFFEESVNTVLQLPLLYDETERRNKNRINALESKIKDFRMPAIDEDAVKKIIKKAEKESNGATDIAMLVDKAYTGTLISAVEAADQDSNEDMPAEAVGTREQVKGSFFATAKAVSDVMTQKDKANTGEE